MVTTEIPNILSSQITLSYGTLDLQMTTIIINFQTEKGGGPLWSENLQNGSIYF